MAKNIDLETLLASAKNIGRKDSSKKEDKLAEKNQVVKEVKPPQVIVVEKEKPEERKVSKSAHDADWKKVGSLMRSIKQKETIDEKADTQIVKPDMKLEDDLALQPQKNNPNQQPDDSKGAYLSSRSPEKAPYAPMEEERNAYLGNERRPETPESTRFESMQRELKLASHIGSERLSEEERLRQEKTYDSLRRPGDKDSTQKYKRLERF